jgi:hypothetical protein
MTTTKNRPTFTPTESMTDRITETMVNRYLGLAERLREAASTYQQAGLDDGDAGLLALAIQETCFATHRVPPNEYADLTIVDFASAVNRRIERMLG